MPAPPCCRSDTFSAIRAHCIQQLQPGQPRSSPCNDIIDGYAGVCSLLDCGKLCSRSGSSAGCVWPLAAMVTSASKPRSKRPGSMPLPFDRAYRAAIVRWICRPGCQSAMRADGVRPIPQLLLESDFRNRMCARSGPALVDVHFLCTRLPLQHGDAPFHRLGSGLPSSERPSQIESFSFPLTRTTYTQTKISCRYKGTTFDAALFSAALWALWHYSGTRVSSATSGAHLCCICAYTCSQLPYLSPRMNAWLRRSIRCHR